MWDMLLVGALGTGLRAAIAHPIEVVSVVATPVFIDLSAVLTVQDVCKSQATKNTVIKCFRSTYTLLHIFLP